jgi:DNA polymerase III delta subunit
MNLYPVIVVSGGSDFLRNRTVKQTVQTALQKGYRLVNINVGNEISFFTLFNGLFTEATVAVLESSAQRKKDSVWSEEVLSMVLDHHKTGDAQDLVLIVEHVGDADATSFAGMVAAALPKALHKVYAVPPWWKEKEIACRFLVTELQNHNKNISPELAEQVIQKVGSELGLLSFEALKFSMLLDVDQRTEVLATDVASVMAPFGGDHWDAFRSALGTKNIKQLMRACANIRSGPDKDAIQLAIGTITSLVIKWLHAAALHAQGVSPEEAAQRIGMHPFPYKHTLLPPALYWGRAALEKLLHDVVKVGVRKGHVSPWVFLESTLIRACLGNV